MVREFRIGTVFRLSFAIWWRNAAPFTLLTTIIYVPLILWAMSLARGQVDAAQVEQFGLVSVGIVSLLNMLLTATLTYGVVMELRGERASLGACVVNGLKRFFPVVGVTLLTTLAIGGATLLLIVPGLIVSCMLWVAVPAAIVERPGLMGALRRSRALTQGNKMQIFGLILLLGMLTGAVSGIMQAVLLEGGSIADTSVERLPTYIYAEVVRIVVFGPLGAVLPAVSYFLLREEREGVSAAELAKVFE